MISLTCISRDNKSYILIFRDTFFKHFISHDTWPDPPSMDLYIKRSQVHTKMNTQYITTQWPPSSLGLHMYKLK